ncbi:ATP-dependent DNA helicase RecQ [Phormidium sp. FACHB-592]|uniref:ATP-dependent DNA helicase RecQ n=1 Tax=Stenomitos frigidus AS-A4 TaxID=2933935 RepID=A0ABV0KFX6_9CYAN|nr:ATP-dependent DNA helicase RecQ [Phormidium sp. FACHB-592]MBD2077955.1 ATP-dependent DNA helicase RecQ [Phormidium sp. FACHB-592]
MNHPSVSVRETIRAKLKQIWGYDDFRSPQGEIVQCLLEQRDALIIMPTGGGKSLCFQLPALMQAGLTIIVSPLVALMENQVQELRQRRLPAALLHSEVSKQQRRQTLWALENQSLRLLYLSPETLLSEAVWERLCQPDLKINGLILDEAHCLVQWGDTFRPAYYRLGVVRPALLKCKPEGTKIAIAAFTATANPDAQQTIQRVLQLQQPEVFRLNPYRANLHLNVQVVWTPRQRRQQMLKFIQAQLGQAGLVYVRTRRDSETLAEWLSQQGFQTAAYHAGLSADERRQLEKAWLGGTMHFVICTCAFGMGIDKPNVRWVVHFHSPLLLSEYVQEVGRAGRDGKPATALTLISETTGWLDPEDKQRRQFFVEQAQKQQRSAQALSHKLPTQGDVASVSRQFKDGVIALSLLNSTGHLEWSDPFHYVMKPGNVDRRGQSNTQAAKQMTEYLKTRDCRWRFLLGAFGFESDALSLRCGHCDNCRH